MNSETPWSAGRLDLVPGPHRLLFGRMYEDAEIEREAFVGRHRVFCIASAGNTALRLADEHEVTACDINPAQLAYAERRLRGAAAETGDAERAMNLARGNRAEVLAAHKLRGATGLLAGVPRHAALPRRI